MDIISSGQQAGEVSRHRSIAFAGRGLETLTILDADLLRGVVDQACAPQRAERECDGGSTNAQHDREEFLGQLKGVLPHPIVGHEEPSGESLFHGMEGVTGDGLIQKDHIRLNVPIDEVM